MRSPWASILFAMLLVACTTHGDPARTQPATAGTLRTALQSTQQAADAADAIVECLADADPSLRHLALAVVLQFPDAFRSAAPRLHALLAAPPDDCVLRAIDAISGFTDLPLPEALQLLASSSDLDVGRALRVLPTFGAELLPHLDMLIAKVDERPSPALLPVFAAAAAHDASAVQAAVEAAMAKAPAPRQLQLFAVLEAAGAPAERRQQHLVRLLGTRGAGELQQRCTQLARDDPSFRAVLATVCAEAPAPAAGAALQVFAALGPLAAEHWPSLEPCLRSAKLVSAAATVALAVRTERPEAVMAMVAAVPQASSNSVPVLANALRQCPEWARESAPALAARLPLAWAPHSAIVLETLFVLGAHDEIRRSLPALFAHAEPGVRALGILFAAAAGQPDQATHERLAALAEDRDASVRETARLTRRLIAGQVEDVELADHLSDRDPHRVLAAWCTLRARTPAFTEVEAVGTAVLLLHHALGSFVEGELLRDLDARRLTPGRCASLLGSQRLRHAGFCERWQRTARGVEVLALLRAQAGPQPRGLEHLMELAAKNPALHEQLLRAGVLPAGTKPLTAGEVATRGSELEQHLLRQLGEADAASRSSACEQLRGLATSGWREQAQRLRRQGTAAERRCTAALLEPMSVRAASAAVEAPETFVVVLGIQALLDAVPRDATAAPAARRAMRLLAERADVAVQLARSGYAAAALRLAAGAGPDAVPYMRAAFAVPAVRSQVLHALPLLGVDARAFLPEVLRALRTYDAGSAACALLVMGLAPGDPEWNAARDAIEAAWSTAGPPGKRQLLPAVVVLGDTSFASDLDSVLRDALRRHGDLQIAPTAPLRSWLELALQSGPSVQRHIATLVLATAALGGPMQTTQRESGVAGELWRRAEELPALRASMQRAVATAPAAELKQLYENVLRAAADDTPLPGTRLLLAARPDMVEQLLQDGRAARMSPQLARELAASVPDLFLRTVARLPVPDHALRQLPPLPAGSLTTLTRLLAEPRCGNRAALARLLVIAGEPARDAVMAQLSAERPPDEEMRAAVQTAGASAEYLVPSLRRSPAVDDVRMLQLVACLGAKGVAAVIEVLGVEAALPYVERAATQGDVATRTEALRRLFVLDRERAAPMLRQAAASPDATLSRWARLMLLPTDGPIVDPDVLLPLLLDEEPLLRRRALTALAASHPWSERFAVLATDLLADPDAGVCAAAVEAFRTNPDQVASSRIALQEARAATATPALAATITEVLAR